MEERVIRGGIGRQWVVRGGAGGAGGYEAPCNLLVTTGDIDAHGRWRLLVGFLGCKPGTPQAKCLQQQQVLKREKTLVQGAGDLNGNCRDQGWSPVPKKVSADGDWHKDNSSSPRRRLDVEREPRWPNVTAWSRRGEGALSANTEGAKGNLS